MFLTLVWTWCQGQNADRTSCKYFQIAKFIWSKLEVEVIQKGVRIRKDFTNEAFDMEKKNILT